MLPHTKDGVMSLDECTNDDNRGFRRHCEALESAVAVSMISGWRIRRFAWEDIVILLEEKVPRMLKISSESM